MDADSDLTPDEEAYFRSLRDDPARREAFLRAEKRAFEENLASWVQFPPTTAFHCPRKLPIPGIPADPHVVVLDEVTPMTREDWDRMAERLLRPSEGQTRG